MSIDWLDKLRALLQTLAFCLAFASIQYAVVPDQRYDVDLTYSLCIGICTWALIDFGRHMPTFSTPTSAWPTGVAGVLFPLVGVILGAAMGVMAADHWFGWSSWSRFTISQLPLVIAITSVPGAVATYYFFSRGKAHDLEKQIKEAARQATEARLRLLEAQLEPHMLFNTLANLRTLIALEPSRAQAMLDHLIAYLRATLSASRATSHSLEQEFERVRDYLELMAVRMGPRLQFTLELPEALRPARVPPLLLQPLVENSIQHGLEPKVEGGSIHVSARLNGQRLCLQVRDNGLGLDPQRTPEPGHGFGLSQVRERLSTLHGDSAAVTCETPATGGTLVSLSFPCDMPESGPKPHPGREPSLHTDSEPSSRAQRGDPCI